MEMISTASLATLIRVLDSLTILGPPRAMDKMRQVKAGLKLLNRLVVKRWVESQRNSPCTSLLSHLDSSKVELLGPLTTNFLKR